MIILHNPRCSKSRETLQLLHDRGHHPEVREYLQNPLSTDELSQLVKQLKLAPKAILRTKEPEFKELHLDLEDDQAVIAAIASQPKLMERPIVINGDKAAVGRPPESVLSII